MFPAQSLTGKPGFGLGWGGMWAGGPGRALPPHAWHLGYVPAAQCYVTEGERVSDGGDGVLPTLAGPALPGSS